MTERIKSFIKEYGHLPYKEFVKEVHNSPIFLSRSIVESERMAAVLINHFNLKQ